MPMIVAPIAGALSDRIGGQRLMGTGLALQAIGLAWIAAVSTPTTPYIDLVAPFTISGSGMALFFAPVANVVLSSVRPAEQGQASGANNAIRELGGVLGVAVLASIFAHDGGYGSRTGVHRRDGAGRLRSAPRSSLVGSVARVRDRPAVAAGRERGELPEPRARARSLSSRVPSRSDRDNGAGGGRTGERAGACSSSAQARRSSACSRRRGSHGHLDGGLRPRSRRRPGSRSPTAAASSRPRTSRRSSGSPRRSTLDGRDRARHRPRRSPSRPGWPRSSGSPHPVSPATATARRRTSSGSARRSPPPGCPSRAGRSCPRTSALGARSCRVVVKARRPDRRAAGRGSSRDDARARGGDRRAARGASRGGGRARRGATSTGPEVTVSGFSAGGELRPARRDRPRLRRTAAAFGVPLAQIWPSPHAEAAIEVARRAVEALGIEDGPVLHAAPDQPRRPRGDRGRRPARRRPRRRARRRS